MCTLTPDIRILKSVVRRIRCAGMLRCDRASVDSWTRIIVWIRYTTRLSVDSVKQHGRRIDSSELQLALTCCLT